MSDIQIPEAFQLDSGLREDMVISIHSSYFAPHGDYQDGHVLLLFLLGTDEADEPVEIRMSVGADWTTTDGTVISHPTRKRQQINKNSIYGHWLDFCFKIPELAKVLIERSDSLGGKGPLDARIWSDLVLHLQSRELVFGRNIEPQERLMPTEYLGYVTDTPIGEAQARVGEAVRQEITTETMVTSSSTIDPQALVRQAQAEAAAVAAASGSGSPTYAKAVALAKAAPDMATFISQALADSDIIADDELAVQCADGTIWASAH